MTIDDAIHALERLRELHGGFTRIYFDCPDCRRSFMPDVAQAERRVSIPARKIEAVAHLRHTQ